MDYTRKEIEKMCPELVIRVIMLKGNGEGRANYRNKSKQQIMDTYIYLNNKRFQEKKKRPVICKKYPQFAHLKILSSLLFCK